MVVIIAPSGQRRTMADATTPRQGRETMTTTHAKAVLAQMIASASEYDRLDDVVMRQQMIRNAMDLPLGLDYIKAALRDAGLPTR